MKRVFVAGHQGMVGSAIMRRFAQVEDVTLLTAHRRELDLRDQSAVTAFLRAQRPDLVIVAAAKVGGILANARFPASFLHDNLMIAANLIQGAHQADVQQLIQLGSSCIYPRNAPQPIREEALLTGPLEPTNEPYAIAKIAAIKLCESYNRQYGRDYRSLMPTNLYGPGDNFHPDHAHVLPALMQRYHAAVQAKSDVVTLWGTGRPRREFLHVDDLADAVAFIAARPLAEYAAATGPMQSHLNVGTGIDITIKELAQTMASLTGFAGRTVADLSKPDGTPRKRLDVEKMAGLGWTARTSFAQGLAQTYDWFCAQLQTDSPIRRASSG